MLIQLCENKPIQVLQRICLFNPTWKFNGDIPGCCDPLDGTNIVPNQNSEDERPRHV